jgi:hypothetical protein
MVRRTCVVLVLSLSAALAHSQVEPSATGGSAPTNNDDSLMSMPPQVSGSFFPSSVGSQTRENYLSGGVIATAAYNDNVLVGETAKPVNAETYFITPSIQWEQTTARTQSALTYSPGFSFYDPTSDLDSVTENLAAEFRYRFTPRFAISGQDSFQQNSTVFSQPYILNGATITGSPDSPGPILILPYAGQLFDSTSAEAGYQFSRSGMFGGSGFYSMFHFTNSSQDEGLSDSTSYGGSGFYSSRFGRNNYVGGTYRYSISNTSPFASNTKSQSGSLFYSFYVSRQISVSLSGGPDYVTLSAPGIPTTSTWAPSGGATVAWQRSRANFVLGYSRGISTGWGLYGAYKTDNGTISASYQFARKLGGTISGNYSDIQNLTALLATTTPSGHTLFGRASLQYQLSEHMTAVAEYSRLHENYGGIAEIANSPNADRAAISVNYQFRRPLGR